MSEPSERLRPDGQEWFRGTMQALGEMQRLGKDDPSPSLAAPLMVAMAVLQAGLTIAEALHRLDQPELLQSPGGCVSDAGGLGSPSASTKAAD